jgi:ABC-type transport system involved in cytochrome bd biosynthesis fused ATPase/permease subunit
MYNIKNNKKLREKTIVMTTNDVNLLKMADKVIFLDNGVIKFNGTYTQLSSHAQYKNLYQQIQKNKT